MTASKPNPVTLVGRVLRQHHPSSLMAARPTPSLWRALGGFFSDERLQQLFAPLCNLCGLFPSEHPGHLMLIAHVELEGVWLVDGGMHRLAGAMAALGQELGIDLHLNTHVSEILVKGGKTAGVRLEDGTSLPADVVVFNGDTNALATGQLGRRSHARGETTTGTKPRPLGPHLVH